MSGSPRAHAFACLVCVLVAILLAVAPHLTMLARTGSPEFLADNDDVFYLALARAPYYGEWAMRDGFLPPQEHVADLHAWTEFVPLAKLGRALHIPAILLSLLWRVLGGALLGGALYWLFQRLFAGTSYPVAWALGCTLICLCDAGFCSGRSLLEDVRLLPQIAHGTTPLAKPDAMAHFRVVTPLLDLPFLILMAAALTSSKERLRNVVLGGVFLGCCVLLYFYLWTAAVMALGCYLGVLLLRRRMDRVKRVGLVLALGLGIGAPQIYYNASVTRDPQIKPYLERSGRPAHLAPGDPARRKNLVNVWVWAKLAIGGAGVLLLSLPGLALLWWLLLSGYALANLAIFTGLEFENFHWVLVHAPMGEVLLLATLVGLVERWGGAGKRWLPAFWVVPAGLLVFALVWRPYEMLHAPMSVAMDRSLQELRPLKGTLAQLGTDRTLAGPWQSQVAMLHSRSAILFDEPYTTVLLIPMEEVNERHALNAWLQGMEPAAYRSSPSLNVTTEFADVRPEWRPENVIKNRLAIFEKLTAQPAEGETLANRMRVTDLLLPASAPAPTRAGPWALLGKCEAWALWTRRKG